MSTTHAPLTIPGLAACVCGWSIPTLSDRLMFQPWKTHATEMGMSDRLIQATLFEMTLAVFGAE